MKIVTIIGARPQFIKAATVSRALRQHSGVREVLVHTGQHFDDNMSEVFFREMGIPNPAYHLGVHGGTHGKMTGQMLEKIEEVLLAEKPDWVLVYGDTNSTLAGALAAVKLHIPLAHVEAGLRSFNRRMPEEINRVLTDHASDLLFAPTQQAVDNLTKEGLDAQKIRRVGDVMCDAARYFSAQAEAGSKVLERLRLSSKAYVLATLHRAENTEDAGRLSDLRDASDSRGRTTGEGAGRSPAGKEEDHVSLDDEPARGERQAGQGLDGHGNGALRGHGGGRAGGAGVGTRAVDGGGPATDGAHAGNSRDAAPGAGHQDFGANRRRRNAPFSRDDESGRLGRGASGIRDGPGRSKG